MTWIIVSVVSLLGLFFSGFFSGAETGLYRVNRLRLHLGVRRRDPRALRLASVLGDEPGALSVTLVGTNVANYVTTSAVAFSFAELWGFGETGSELYTVAIVTPVIFVFGEMVPKNLFRLHPDALLAHGSRLLAIANRLFRLTGIVWALTHLSVLLSRLTGSDLHSAGVLDPKQRVKRLLQEALAGDTLGSDRIDPEDQSDLIERVCQLSETSLHAVMVPRNRVIGIAADTDRHELVRIVRLHSHARLPVYESAGSRTHIIGLAKVDELLQSDDWERVAERLRPALKLSPRETVATAITRLQRAGRGMAVVVDDSGRMLGIVTLKDLLSEVVGESAFGGPAFESDLGKP